jgi:hypothetical protein
MTKRKYPDLNGVGNILTAQAVAHFQTVHDSYFTLDASCS